MSERRNSNSRRDFLKSTLVAISTVTLSNEASSVLAHPTKDGKYVRFLNEPEKQFLEPAVDRLIPPDQNWPGASGAGVVNYIDLQMAGPWGRGELLYRHGPFRAGTPSQGYQLEYTPAELLRRSIAAINAHFTAQGKSFGQLVGEEQDIYLANLEKGGIDLDGVPSNVFFDFLLKYTVEGFFCDPIYGGNKNKVGWQMLSFPGAYADYYDLIDKHGIQFHPEPLSIGDGASSHSMTGGQEGK